ncbi:phosphotransferase [Sphingobium chlorophenolicum]|nr:phosphotransferase [Sphingobium chlorophenolicum]
MMSEAYPADALPLPLTPEQIDSAWLTRALRQRLPGITVRDSHVIDVILGTSTKIRVGLAVEGEGAGQVGETLIVKGGFEEHSPKMAAMYANETRFYADIQPLIPMPSPRAWFAGTDPHSHQSIVIMEDLKRPGVDFCDALRPHRFDQIARRMETMAAYHAATWASPHFQPGGRWSDIASRFDGWGLDYMRRYLAPDVWSHYMALPRGAAVSTRLHDREWMERALMTIGEIQRTQPRCLIHGDTHLGNLYILEDGTPGYFDAQVAQTAWHHEVSYHIVCAADLADRAAWERDLLRLYLDALERQGGPVLDRDTAWLDYRRSILWGLFIFLTNEVRFQTEAVNTAYAARFGQAALDHDLHLLLP